MQSRAWAVFITFELCGTAVVRMRVDGFALLPEVTVMSPLEALEYIDEALIDFRRGDQITLIAQQRSETFISTWSTHVRALALHWCAEALQVAACERGLAVARNSGKPRPATRVSPGQRSLA